MHQNPISDHLKNQTEVTKHNSDSIKHCFTPFQQMLADHQRTNSPHSLKAASPLRSQKFLQQQQRRTSQSLQNLQSVSSKNNGIHQSMQEPQITNEYDQTTKFKVFRDSIGQASVISQQSASSRFLQNSRFNILLTILIFILLINIGLGIISLTTCYQDRKYYLEAYHAAFFFSGKWVICLFISLMLLLMYCISSKICCCNQGNLCENTVGALPILYFGLITLSFLFSIPIGYNIIISQHRIYQSLERSNGKTVYVFQKQGNQLVTTDAQLFFSQKYIQNHQWRFGLYGIPSILAAYIISEMIIASILCINFCIFLFCVKGTNGNHLINRQTNNITQKQLKSIELQIQQIERESRKKSSMHKFNPTIQELQEELKQNKIQQQNSLKQINQKEFVPYQ